MSPVDAEFIARRTVEVWLHDGGRILMRPIVPDDKQILLAAYERLSEESKYRRFMGARPLTEGDLVYLTEIDYVDHFALVVGNAEDETEGIGVARYVREPNDPGSAEAAVAVVDAHHGRGIGTLLLSALGAVAMENGIRRFTGYMLSDNRPAMDLVRGLGARVEYSHGEGRMVIDLPQQMEELKATPLYAVLRAVARGEAPPPQPAVRRVHDR